MANSPVAPEKIHVQCMAGVRQRSSSWHPGRPACMQQPQTLPPLQGMPLQHLCALQPCQGCACKQSITCASTACWPSSSASACNPSDVWRSFCRLTTMPACPSDSASTAALRCRRSRLISRSHTLQHESKVWQGCQADSVVASLATHSLMCNVRTASSRCDGHLYLCSLATCPHSAAATKIWQLLGRATSLLVNKTQSLHQTQYKNSLKEAVQARESSYLVCMSDHPAHEASHSAPHTVLRLVAAQYG